MEIVGNANSLLQLRRQIDRALKDDESVHPLDEAPYRDNLEEEYGVVVTKAGSRAEMEPPKPPKSEKAPERPPWAQVALSREEARKGEGKE